MTDAQLLFPPLSSRSVVQTCMLPFLHPRDLLGAPQEAAFWEVWCERQLPSREGWLLGHATTQTLLVLLWELGHLTHIPPAEITDSFWLFKIYLLSTRKGKEYLLGLIWKDLGHLNP